jgi:hypothetical protein
MPIGCVLQVSALGLVQNAIVWRMIRICVSFRKILAECGIKHPNVAKMPPLKFRNSNSLLQ